MKIRYLIISMLLAYTSTVMSQDLKDLRALPDTSINKRLSQDSSLHIRNINVPIPKLGLTVNYWKHWSKFGVNANQAAFSDNWSAGGVNSFAWASTIWHKSEFDKNDFNFTSEVDLRYGRLRNGQISDKDLISRKNVDRLFWDNKLAYKFLPRWSVYTSLTWETTFDVGHKYGTNAAGRDSITSTVSAFMAPGYFTESLGLEYTPDKTFSLRIGTGTARQTFVLDERIDPTTFGVEPGKRMLNELAFQLTANLDRNITDKFNIKSRYNMFADYKDIGNPDHRLDLTLTAKITQIISVTFTGVALYDSQYIYEQDTKPRVQWSQNLAMGLLFALPR